MFGKVSPSLPSFSLGRTERAGALLLGQPQDHAGSQWGELSSLTFEEK